MPRTEIKLMEFYMHKDKQEKLNKKMPLNNKEIFIVLTSLK